MQMELVANDAATDAVIAVDVVATAAVAAAVAASVAAGTAACGRDVSRRRKQVQTVICRCDRLFISHHNED